MKITAYKGASILIDFGWIFDAKLANRVVTLVSATNMKLPLHPRFSVRFKNTSIHKFIYG